MLVDDYDPLKGRMFQVLDKDGKVDKKLEPAIDEKRLLQAYRTMVLTRIADEKSVRLQRQGRLGAYPPSKGQEASQVGPAMALGEDDWLVWAFRELGALLMHGAPLWRTLMYWMGNEAGSQYGEGVRITPSSVPVGSQIPHAVGISFASMYRKEKSVALCFFGDGGSSEGDFHEGLNFAGVMKTPTVFVCQNNQYAISLPRELQTASKTIAQKAVAYGFPGILVDGNDVLALYAATKEAVERARRGEGPTLIESFTYRISDHTTSDDATRYRTEKELKYWTERDPITRFRAYLVGKGMWDDAREKALQAELAKFVEDEVKKAESYPHPSLEEVYSYTYASISDNLRSQLEQHQRDLDSKEG
ncbi:MAG: pyruvate dehydrogenase (acetyl-transferring) E1 component subunit alpha [Methanomassiliicoccales archaeon]|nr:pyruvate dehydrogenase (acetyl-transferring) E1 component subunit alpha [Methanomassiliicoccales archaeon]